MTQQRVSIYDTTLRDGTQAEGVAFSRPDKVKIAERLDAIGVDYIEGGWPGSNPRDMEFFDSVRNKNFEHTKVAAFGSTRRAQNTPENDPNLKTLLEAETPVVTIFGKAWLFHVHEVLRVTPDQNLNMVEESCRFLIDQGKEVIFDAEHFFDGYVDDPVYATAVLRKAVEGGAKTIVLCDTNGGIMPDRMQSLCREIKTEFKDSVQLGIHCHNDNGCAVANTLLAVDEDHTHVQGTINGLGERCGNANLSSIIPGLQLKKDFECLRSDALEHLTELSNFVYDVANITPDSHQPYVGRSAFAHKGGMHVNAVQKEPSSFEHVPPESVGNERRILVSDLSGGANIKLKAAEHNIDLEGKSDEARQILQELKRLESEGYEFEAADASFYLLLQKQLKTHRPYFTLEGFRVIIEKRGPQESPMAEATIKINVEGETEITAAEGDGPVNALDKALRKVLTQFYPAIANVNLRDFKVRILEGGEGTAAKTRVLIESTDGKSVWGTVGVSENIIEASWEALVDSMEYILYKNEESKTE